MKTTLMTRILGKKCKNPMVAMMTLEWCENVI